MNNLLNLYVLLVARKFEGKFLKEKKKKISKNIRLMSKILIESTVY